MHDTCARTSRLSHIRTHWPKLLFLSTAVNGGPGNAFHPHALEWPTSFSILDTKDGKYVDYTLAGRIYYASSHFTTEILVSGQWYYYDDRDDVRKGSGIARPGYELLQPLQSPSPSTESAASIYVRVSEKAVVGVLGSGPCSDELITQHRPRAPFPASSMTMNNVWR